MAFVTDKAEAARLVEAAPVMAEMIESALAEYSRARASSLPSTLQLAVALPPVDPLRWLELQQMAERVYWSDRAGDFETAGVGRADQIDTAAANGYSGFPARLEPMLDTASETQRYYGGFRFHNGGNDHEPEWRRFGSGRLLLPRFELQRFGKEGRFVCNLLPHLDNPDDLKQMLSALVFAIDFNPPTLPSFVDRLDHPDRTAWETGVGKILDAVGRGELSKAVLARRTTLRFASAVDPVGLLRRLKARSAGCFHFCFQFAPSAAFIGASPERLYRRRGHHIEAEAVAGTRPRGRSVDEDNELGRDLMHSEKETSEHRFVIDDIAHVLKRICRTWKQVDHHGEDSLMKLARVQHLVTRLEGELANGRTDASILTMLHPTSAVGGVPPDKALPLIETLEPFDRGWYGGPVGWVGRDGAEFAVGIRSGLIDGDRLHLYSGAGIVTGSSPEGEWDEIESKLANFLAALM